MKNNEPIRVVVAEASVIIRSGVITILKRIPNLHIHPMEVVSMESLRECVRTHDPDILIVNPLFGGWFDLSNFKDEMPSVGLRYVSLVCSVMDSTLLKEYDETVSMYDNITTLSDKINKLRHIPVEDDALSGQEALSQREKEIIVCVVKGMTNKAIADKLFLSIHTVITHRRNIARKLQIHSPAGLTIYAILNKLVELQDIEG